MHYQLDPDLYRECEAEFLAALAGTIRACVERASLTPAASAKLISELTFAVAAHLSGSSYGGCVRGEEIYPVLGFARGETDPATYFGAGSALHELVSGVLDAQSAPT